MSSKSFVVIAANGIEPGFYDHWGKIKDAVEGIKKASGIRIEWRGFTGNAAQQRKAGLEYWHLFNEDPPPHLQASTAGQSTAPPARQPPTRKSSRHKTASGQWQESYSGSHPPAPTDWTEQLLEQSIHAQHQAVKEWVKTETEVKSRAVQGGFRHEPVDQPPRGRAAHPLREGHRSKSESASRDRGHPSSRLPSNLQASHDQYAKWTEAAKEEEIKPRRRERDSQRLRGQTDLEGHLLRRIQQLNRLKSQVPRPPAREPVDKGDIHASIVTEEWARAQGVPVASDILDGEIALALEVYGRILREGPELQLEGVLTYLTIVDAKRDWHTKVAGQITYDCLDKHAKGVRQQAHDKAAIAGLKQTLANLNDEFAQTVDAFADLKNIHAAAARTRISKQAAPLLKQVQNLQQANDRLVADKLETLAALQVRVELIAGLKVELDNLRNDKVELEAESLFQIDDLEGEWVSKADLQHDVQRSEEKVQELLLVVKRLKQEAKSAPAKSSIASLKARNLALVHAKTDLESQLGDLKVNLRARAADCDRLSRELNLSEVEVGELKLQLVLPEHGVPDTSAQTAPAPHARSNLSPASFERAFEPHLVSSAGDQLTDDQLRYLGFQQHLLDQEEYERDTRPERSFTQARPERSFTQADKRVKQRSGRLGAATRTGTPPSPDPSTPSGSPPGSPFGDVPVVSALTDAEYSPFVASGFAPSVEGARESSASATTTAPKQQVRSAHEQAAAGKNPSRSTRQVRSKRGRRSAATSCETDLADLDLTLASIDLTAPDWTLDPNFTPCPKCPSGSGKPAGHVGRHIRATATTTTVTTTTTIN